MNTQKSQMEEASIRLALIQPAIHGTYPDASKRAYYGRICEQPVRLPNGIFKTYSPGTLSCWESMYIRHGFEALMPKQRSDKGNTRKLDSDAQAYIHRMKEELPKINATEIYHKLIADGIVKQKEISLSTIQRYVKQHLLHTAPSGSLRDRKAFEEEFCGGMYQADTLYGPYLNEQGIRRRTYLIMIVDDKSRMIVGGRFFYQDNAYHFQKVLRDAVSSRGIPNKLYVDNGSPYRNEQLSLICGSLGIVLLHAPVRDGASKGKVERNFRTLRNRFLNILDVSTIPSLEALNALLFKYIHKHNTTIHSATGETPSDRYTKDSSYIRVPKSEEWLHACFHNRVQRRVRNDATILIDRVLYDVPMQFIKCKVEVRYLPDDMEHAYVFHQDNAYPIQKTKRVENGKTKRNNQYSIHYGGNQDGAL